MRQHGHWGIVRGVAGVLLGTTLLAASNGCTHNYYYGAPACGPTVTAPSAVEYGAVCEVPGSVVNGGTVITSRPLNSTPTLGGARPPRVVVSQPNGSSRLGWHAADPDNGLATRVEGALDDPTLTR